MKERKNKKNEAVDKYSASYYYDLVQYLKSEKRIYDILLQDIYNKIQIAAKQKLYFTEIPLYSKAHDSYYFQLFNYDDEHRNKVVKSIIEFLKSKGFTVSKVNTHVCIYWKYKNGDS